MVPTSSTHAPSIAQLTGQASDHLVPYSESVQLHREVVPVFENLRASAAGQGIDLAIASGFRSFQRQLKIWNDKAEGERPVLDRNGEALDISLLSERELMFAILRWSALPGASRHHWGTDMDVWDMAAVPGDYQLQLSPREYSPGGPFAALNHWLGSEQVSDLGFVRPYATDRGGIAPEAWHLSYLPVAHRFASCLVPALLGSLIEHTDIALKGTILDHLEEIYRRFVVCDV